MSATQYETEQAARVEAHTKRVLLMIPEKFFMEDHRDKLLDVNELAELVGVSVRTIVRHVKGGMPHARLKTSASKSKIIVNPLDAEAWFSSIGYQTKLLPWCKNKTRRGESYAKPERARAARSGVLRSRPRHRTLIGTRPRSAIDEYLSASEAALRVGVTDRTVSMWRRTGRLKGLRDVESKCFWYAASDVDAVQFKGKKVQS